MAEANMDACKCDQDLSMVLGMNQERRKGRREERRKGGGRGEGRRMIISLIFLTQHLQHYKCKHIKGQVSNPTNKHTLGASLSNHWTAVIFCPVASRGLLFTNYQTTGL